MQRKLWLSAQSCEFNCKADAHKMFGFIKTPEVLIIRPEYQMASLQLKSGCIDQRDKLIHQLQSLSVLQIPLTFLNFLNLVSANDGRVLSQ